jgi:hypothetical protein
LLELREVQAGMTTLTIKAPRMHIARRRKDVYFSGLRPFVDHGYHAPAEPMKDPPALPRVVLTVEKYAERLKRHNALQPALVGTHRLLLRWGESGGNGLPNPEADVRELHYDPLPPDLQTRVDAIVEVSPWASLTRKWYRTDLTVTALADDLCVSRRQLYYDWGSSLWYYRGRFESECVHE